MKLPTLSLRTEMLEAWLRLAGYTKAQLANRLSVTRGRVSQLFRNQAEPSAHLIAKLLVVTELPFERLFEIRKTVSLRKGSLLAGRRHPSMRRSKAVTTISPEREGIGTPTGASVP